MAGEDVSVRISKALFGRIKPKAARIWGEKRSSAETVQTVLQDWVSRQETSASEDRLRGLEERLLTLERREISPTNQANTTVSDLPTVLEPRIQAVLSSVNNASFLDDLEEQDWPPSEDPGDGYSKVVVERCKKGERLGYLAPEAFLGFRSGAPVDLDPYIKHGFTPARSQERYKLADPQFRALLKHIVATEGCSPLLIYSYGRRLIVLDGLARLSAVGLARRRDPGAFAKVPYIYIARGQNDRDARELMITRNLSNGPRALTREEVDAALSRLQQQYT